jgi:hypothetical protein
MRQLRYSVAMSLDGFIAGPKGEYDWIVHDPAFEIGGQRLVVRRDWFLGDRDWWSDGTGS